MATHNDTGKEGEVEACAWLKKKGYQILHTNWRWHHYELDIIALHDNVLVVIEVKTRSAIFLLPPEEAGRKAKIRRSVAATDAFIRKNKLDIDVRFDLILVIKEKGTHQIVHIEDAFYAPIKN